MIFTRTLLKARKGRGTGKVQPSQSECHPPGVCFMGWKYVLTRQI
jgi:hypothetical protein